MARVERNGGVDCSEKAVVLLLVEGKTVIFGKLDEIDDVVDVELLLDG